MIAAVAVPTHQQQPAIPTAFLSTRAYIASLAPGELPVRCPWLGHTAICPTFAPNRRTHACLDCGREFTRWPD